MIIKKFTGKNEEEATALARKELGSGVVIMNVKSLKKGGIFGFFKAPQVEVTAAVEEVNDTTVSNSKPVTYPQHLPKKVTASDVISDDRSRLFTSYVLITSGINAKLSVTYASGNKT